MPQQLHEITFTWNAARWFGSSGILPHTPYYVTPLMLAELQRHEHRAGFQVVASAHDRFPYADKLWQGGNGAPDLNNKHVAYFHDGRLGDELIHSATYRAIREHYPACDLTVYVSGPRRHVAMSNQFLGMEPRIASERFTPQEMEAYDYWIMPSPVGYLNRGSERNIYDLVAEEVGVAPELRQPYVYITGEERIDTKRNASAASRNGDVPKDFFERLVVIQLNSMEEERSPANWYDRLQTLRAALPGHYFAVVGDYEAAAPIHARWKPPYPGAVGYGPIPGAFFFLQGGASMCLNARGLLVMIEHARLVIAPDSFLMHASAAFNVPCIALWQYSVTHTAEGLPIPPPQSRVSTYPNVCVMDMDAPHEEIAMVAQNILGER